MSSQYTSATEYVTAFFDTRNAADNAVDALVAEGISRGEIKVVAGADSTSSTGTTTEPVREKGFFESIGDFFMPEEDRYSYAEGLRRGGFLVTVPTSSANRDRVLDILDDEGSVNMDEREESWRSEGWTAGSTAYGRDASYTAGETIGTVGTTTSRAYDSVTTGSAATTGTTARAATGLAADADTAGTIEVVEEKLRVGKRDVSHGRVRVRSYVVSDDVSQDVNLRSERVEIERRPVDRAVDGATAFTDRTIELEETAQEAVISKEARVKEEIDLAKVAADRVETVSDTVRRTEVEIEDERSGKTIVGDDRTTRRAL